MTANEVKAAVLVATLYEGPLPAPAWAVKLVAAVLDDCDAQVKYLEKRVRELEVLQRHGTDEGT
jgi:hypothetical protein